MAFAGRLFHEDAAPDPNWHLCTLREIFDRWFVPTILQASRRKRKRPASAATLQAYRDSLTWWESLTGNPPSAQITEETLDAFVDGLAIATYRRGPVSREKKLSEFTQAKHVRGIRTILDRLYKGAAKPRLEILAERASLPTFEIDALPKLAPDFEQFKQIFDKLSSAVSLKLCSPPNVQPVDFWRALLATLYCHGWRLQTALSLDWKYLQPGPINRLMLPSDANFKTHKSAVRPVPDWLLVHWRRQNIRFRTGAWPIPSEGPIFGGPWVTKTIERSWKKLQKAARPGCPTFSLQSLRRLHGDQIDAVGYSFTSKLVQASLQHSSNSVTSHHYVNSIERAILRLPEV